MTGRRKRPASKTKPRAGEDRRQSAAIGRRAGLAKVGTYGVAALLLGAAGLFAVDEVRQTRAAEDLSRIGAGVTRNDR